MPDIDAGQRGTGIVHVIKLQLDVNHDAVMDLSFGGPDNTSQDRPFVFWVNNDYDRVSGQEQDDLARAWNPDCEYHDLYGRIIPTQRDLEDFARLWVCGPTSNMLATLPLGVTGELSWGDKDNPNTNNPTIDLFVAARTDGGIGYLTNLADAYRQTDIALCATLRLGPGQSITVFSNGLTAQSFIWCGVKEGSGALTLTVTQGGTNTLAQTFAFIELKDIKQMYERWTVGDNPNLAPTNRPRLAQERVLTPFQYATPSDTNTPYILQVHDYDLPTWKKDRYAETAFKRLYWQGYQGRFGLFRWPGVYNGIVRPLDDSEFNAWRSAAGLLNLLTNLNAEYPGNVHLIAHGYGTIVAGEALRLAATNEVVNTYIAMQGAVPSHAYDSWAPFRTFPPGTFDGTPDRYSFYYTNPPPEYFSGAGGALAYINYFNTNDYVLTNYWRSDQDSKPALPFIPGYGYHWDGTNFFKSWPWSPTPLVFPTDTYEIFSYCDEARCEAIGAQPNLGLPFVLSAQVDLSVFPYSFGNDEKDHSAQFLSYYAFRWEFWAALLRSIGLR